MGSRKIWTALVATLLVPVVMGACAAKPPAAPAKPAQPAAQPQPSQAAAPTPAAKPAAAPATPAAPAAAAPAPAGPILKTKTKVKIVIPTQTLSYAPIFVADKAGYYAEENIEVQEIVYITGAPAYAALKAGDVQIMGGDTSRMYQLAGQGETSFMLVQSMLDGVSMDVTFTKPYAAKHGVSPKSPLEQRLKALKGGKWGVGSLGSVVHVMLAYLGKKVNIDPEKEMEFIRLDAVGARLAAAEKGAIDGFMLSPPTSFVAEKAGYGITMVPYYDVPEFTGVPHQTMIVTREYADKNPDVVRAVARANAKARSMLAKSPDKAVEYLAKVWDKEDPAILLASTRHLQKLFGDNVGTLDAASLDRHQDLVVASGSMSKKEVLKEEVHWTNRFLK